MRAEDLQIGDYIQNPFGLVGRVQSIKYMRKDSGDVYGGHYFVTLAFGESDQTFDIKDAHPIPITQEILEKNGFGKFDFPNIEKQHKWYLPLDTLSYISLWTRELNDNSSNGWMCNIEKQPAASGCFMIVNIHDLQHLIKLAGIDKEIQI